MSQTKAQLVSPLGNVDVSGGIIVSGATTAGTFSGNITGTATGLSGTPNLNVGVITATSFRGDGSNLTGIAATPFVGQNVTSVAGVTTINLSNGSIIYFTHNTDTTVAFANTSTTQSITFIRTKDDTVTPRSLTWPTSVVWTGGVTPTLINNPRSTDAQQFNLLTRDGGLTWYGHQEVGVDINTNALFFWGNNSQGQLGLNDRTQYSSPVQIPGTTWKSISAGNNHSLATKTDGTLWAWGYNQSGELGQNNITYASSPVQIPGTTWSSASSASGNNHSLATKTDGTLWAWGFNFYGNLGLNNRTSYSSPVQIPGTTWSFVNAGSASGYAIKTDGTLWSWGYNSGGFEQLPLNTSGISYSSPVQVPGTTWRSVVSKQYSSLATKTDGTLWAWGFGSRGQLAQNNTIRYSSPVQIPGNTWSSISSGYAPLATKTDGTLWSWGRNQYGQLGLNNTIDRSSPVQIPGTTWSSISSANDNSLATKTDGTLWSWGYNAVGQLGQNNRTEYSSPVQIPGTTWSSVSVSKAGRFTSAIQYI